MIKMGEKERKTRSDKKRRLPVPLKRSVHEKITVVAANMERPLGQTAAIILEIALENRQVIKELQKRYVRTDWIPFINDYRS